MGNLVCSKHTHTHTHVYKNLRIKEEESKFYRHLNKMRDRTDLVSSLGNVQGGGAIFFYIVPLKMPKKSWFETTK